MNNDRTLYQAANYPHELAALVARLRYKPGWRFELRTLDRGQTSVGLTMTVTVATTNSYPPHEPMQVAHLMPVPPAAYDVRSWQRWLLDQILLVEQHEACEFFTLDGVKPYAPSHGPGSNPYLIREIGTESDQRTSFRGELT